MDLLPKSVLFCAVIVQNRFEMANQPSNSPFEPQKQTAGWFCGKEPHH